MHEPIKLHITRGQVAKIRQGHPIRIPHAHIGHPQGHVFRHLHPETFKKLVRAHRARKGAVIHLTEPELEGTGLKDIFRKIGKFFTDNKAIIKPIASTLLDVGAQLYPKAAPARALLKEKTGWGVRAHKAPVRRKAPARHKAPMRARGLVPAGYAGF